MRGTLSIPFALWLYLIADFAEERLVRDPRWCGSRQDTGPQPELQQEEKYFNKSKNIYTTSWRHITRYPALQQQEWPHYLLSKGTKRYQNWCPIIFGCDDAMLCWLTAHSWRTLHSDGTVMAFLKQLRKTKRLILCKKINIILSPGLLISTGRPVDQLAGRPAFLSISAGQNWPKLKMFRK